MIATLHGEIQHKEDNALIVDVGGVGLRVFAAKSLVESLKVGEKTFLFTHLIVRETELSLYGFENAEERQLFLTLLGVDGVGPRVALSVLATLSLDAVQRAVFSEEPELLSRVPGVGKKTAQKIVLYLQDRLKPTDVLGRVASMSDSDSEVLAALTSLGYSVVEAQTAIQAIPKDAPGAVEERLRLALGYFNR
ncbi:MAG TPA: Holliday junction branch migration protein RuvA [Anaerolineae bacterium]|jgi:Holliday junction DNA helicase RuvA|nr:Holliday junction branch migration protein RuvA [Anaerolineae bacterium]